MLIKEKKKTPVVKLAKKPLNTGNKESIGFEPSVHCSFQMGCVRSTITWELNFAHWCLTFHQRKGAH